MANGIHSEQSVVTNSDAASLPIELIVFFFLFFFFFFVTAVKL